MPRHMNRRAFAGLALAAGGLSGCAATDPLEEPELADLGDFNLGLSIVVSDNAKQIPPSRRATKDDLKTVLTSELDRRFRRYQGSRDYHIAVAIDGYALALPGIPVVLTPRSIMIVTANVWTADPQEKILGPEQIATLEGLQSLLLGTGLIMNAEEQLQLLARNTAAKIETWMRVNNEVFGVPEA